MIKIKKVVETEVEIPAPDHMVLTWRNPKFDSKELMNKQYVEIGETKYTALSSDCWREVSLLGTGYFGDQYQDIMLRIEFQKIITVAKEKK